MAGETGTDVTTSAAAAGTNVPHRCCIPCQVLASGLVEGPRALSTFGLQSAVDWLCFLADLKRTIYDPYGQVHESRAVTLASHSCRADHAARS